MNIYVENDYRKVLKRAVQERKRIVPQCTFQNMAEVIRVQKSYLSRVINGAADLSSDQLFLACDYLEFDERQREYAFLLLEHARCGLKKRKDQLGQRIRKIQLKHLETKEHLQAEPAAVDSVGLSAYYLDPLFQIIHICLSIERYQKDLNRLAKDLRLPPQRILSAVQRLEQLGIIGREKNGSIQTLIKNIHLPRESPVYAAWRNQLKLLSMQQVQNLATDQTYNFAVVFSADPLTREKIQARFLEFLKETEGLVKKAPTTEVYQMNFDLLNWTSSSSKNAN